MAQEEQFSLMGIDWGEQWKKEQRRVSHDDTPAYWDNRAPAFGTKRGMSDYQLEFIKKLELEPGDTVFDMGCGNGAIAIPLAEAGYQVIARDFSSGMLAELAKEMQAKGITSIDYAQMSWEDDWEAHGITVGMVDVAFASRSIITADFKAALMKLSRAARKKACATVSTGANPHTSALLLRELGATRVSTRDAMYAYNILLQEGYFPDVSYITSNRFDSYESYEDALNHVKRMIDAGAPYITQEDYEKVLAAAPAWLEDNLVPNEIAGTVNSHNEVEGPLRITVPREVRWAFLSWEV